MMKDPFDQGEEIVPFVEEFPGATNGKNNVRGAHRRKDDQPVKSGNHVSAVCSLKLCI
jgi:hypothetical protein